MLDFMDYIQLCFSDATGWNRDNSFSSLTATANSLLDFSTPQRLRVHLSSLSTPQFATSYTLGTVGLIDGSVSYLFSTVPLADTPSRSSLIPLRNLVPGYRQVHAPVGIEHHGWDDFLRSGGSSADAEMKATLLHATLQLPPPTTLNALFLRRLSPTTQLTVALSSTRATPLYKSAPQASLLTQISQDTGKYSTEYLFSTDNALFGFRGLWNFGPDPRNKKDKGPNPKAIPPQSQSVSLVSAGGEAYYSPVSSLIGLSTGLRFTTLPAATESPSPSSQAGQACHPTPSPISTFPYTLTLTLTPLTGSLSTTYSLRASPNLAFSSRFSFNVYSWESEMVAGCELWRSKRSSYHDKSSLSRTDDLAWARQKMGLPPTAVELPSPKSSSSALADMPLPQNRNSETAPATDSVIKIRVDQSWNMRLLWEGRVKELLVSAGVGLGPGSLSPLSAPQSPTSTGSGSLYGWHGVGVSVSYSS